MYDLYGLNIIHHTVETSPYRTDGRTDGRTREGNVTQPLDAGRLSFAICWNIQMTHCQLMQSTYSRSVTKFLKTSRMKKNIFQKYHEKAGIHSFPTMYNILQSKVNGLAMRSNFLPKKPSKQLLMITGRELSDELSGSSLASILSDRWPLEFFSEYHDKLPKTDIFCFLANYLRF